MGAALGGVLVAQIGYGAISALLAIVILLSALVMTFLVTDKAIAEAHVHFGTG